MFTSNKSLLNKTVAFMIGLFAIAFTFYACDTTSSVDESIELSKELEKVGKLHNKGLEKIILSMKNPETDFSSQAEVMDLVIFESINASESDNEITRSITNEYVKFVAGNIGKYKSSNIYNLSGNSSLVLPDSTWDDFSEQAKSGFLTLITLQDNYLDIESLESDINEFLINIENSDLILEEKLALISGAQTALKSNQYWDENLDEWLSLITDTSDKSKLKAGWRDHVKADVGGAVVGAFVGGRMGAIGGAAAGGVGAVPGAIAGAAGGAIAAGCGASAASIISDWIF